MRNMILAAIILVTLGVIFLAFGCISKYDDMQTVITSTTPMFSLDCQPVTNWGIYSSTDGKVKLQYPTDWTLNTLNEKDGVISLIEGNPHDLPPIMQIMIIQHNGISFDSRIEMERKNPNETEAHYVLNGSHVIEFRSENEVMLYIDKKDFYVTVSSGSQEDCKTQKVLQSLYILDRNYR